MPAKTAIDPAANKGVPASASVPFSPRQREVLTAALDLMMEQGDRLTMTGVARRARCSKETLYKWFGDRQGLLTATVQWQAAKVKSPDIGAGRLDRETLQNSLGEFAESWLNVLTGDISIALNRFAVGRASLDAGGADKTDLGQIVLHNGPFEMARRVLPLLELARDEGLLSFDTGEEAFRSFFGLVVRDVQIRLLLGDKACPSPQAIKTDAARASEQFLALYGRK